MADDGPDAVQSSKRSRKDFEDADDDNGDGASSSSDDMGPQLPSQAPKKKRRLHATSSAQQRCNNQAKD